MCLIALSTFVLCFSISHLFCLFQPKRKDYWVLHRSSRGSLEGGEGAWDLQAVRLRTWRGKQWFWEWVRHCGCSDRFCWSVLLDHRVQEITTARLHITASLYLWPFCILLRSYVQHCFLCTNFDRGATGDSPVEGYEDDERGLEHLS